MRHDYRLSFLLLSLAVLASAASGVASAAPRKGKNLDKIQHIVVIYLENHSFDSLYGLFPGADGIAAAKPENVRQIDAGGQIYDKLPPSQDSQIPANLPNQPFEIGQYVAPDQKITDLPHRFYLHQAQINHGAMNRYAGLSEAGGLVLGHYDGHRLPLWKYAERYTLADHFFQAAFGGSFLNHQWLACACTPRFDHAGEKAVTNGQGEVVPLLNDKGVWVKEASVTADGFAVNTVQPAQGPHPASADPSKLLPPQTAPTLGDRLTEKHIDWVWYAGGWNDAVAGHAAPNFQFHHQPYAYFKPYAEGSEGRRRHLKDAKDFFAGIAKGKLPKVAFYKPIGDLNEHPGYADLLSGDQHVADLIGKIERSKLWKNTVIVVTYDEYGGFWDHVAPPPGDRWGPGTRVPAIIVSPFAKRGYVDHTSYDTTSILKMIETRFGLKPLGERDAKANDLLDALEL